MTLRDSSILGLPRILCLHGGGTNSHIFRMQCRVLENTLHSTFRLVYAEAPFLSDPGPDVTSVYRRHGPFKSWLRTTPGEGVHESGSCAKHIHAAIIRAMGSDSQSGAIGDWVGVLGFSQGAKIAASIILTQQTMQEGAGDSMIMWPRFRFAVLMAGRGPLIRFCPEWENDTLHGTPQLQGNESQLFLDSDDCIVRIPTLHVHGLLDPGLKLHQALRDRYFTDEESSILEWEGDHRLPIKRKDVDAVVQKIRDLAKLAGVVQP